jgi:Holliday junction resolvase RusA-like endonuclease
VNALYRFARGAMYLTREGRDYKEVAGMLLKAARVPRVEGAVWFEYWAYPPDRRKRDLSNLIKIVEDAAEAAGVFKDDCQVSELHGHKCPPDRSRPRVEVLIRGVEASATSGGSRGTPPSSGSR